MQQTCAASLAAICTDLYFLSNSFLMWLAISVSLMNSFIANVAISIASFSMSSAMSTVFTIAWERDATRGAKG